MSYPYQSRLQYDRIPGRRRVVITGIGAVSAAGVGVKPLWESLLAGRGSVGRVTHYNAEGLPISIAGEVRDFDPASYIPAALKPKRMARHTQFAVVAAQEAVADAKLDADLLKAYRVAVVVGSSTGTSEVIETDHPRDGSGRLARREPVRRDDPQHAGCPGRRGRHARRRAHARDERDKHV